MKNYLDFEKEIKALEEEVEGLKNKYIPGLLMIYIHLAASRPCFERRLKIPGFLAIFLSFLYIIKILYIC